MWVRIPQVTPIEERGCYMNVNKLKHILDHIFEEDGVNVEVTAVTDDEVIEILDAEVWYKDSRPAGVELKLGRATITINGKEDGHG